MKNSCYMLADAHLPKIICAVPVRMLEAWLLFDKAALRRAAGNPAGSIKIDLPSMKELENLPDPKHILYELLESASGLSGRKLKQFRPQQCVHNLAEYIEDFAPLRKLSAFHALENEILGILSANGNS